MKKKLLFTSIAVLVFGLIAVYFFFFNTKETELLSKVPANAKSVVIIDIKGLSTRLLVDELSSDEKSSRKLAEMLPDSLPAIDFANSGMNLLDKAVLFTIELNADVWSNLLLPIADYQTFISFKDSLVASGDFVQRANGDFLVSEKYKLAVNWDRNFVHISNCTFYPANNVHGLIETLHLAPDMSILNDSLFKSKLSGEYDFFLYTTPYTNHPKKLAKTIASNFVKSFSYIRFYDGELVIDTEIELIKGSPVDSIFKGEKNPVRSVQHNDSTGLVASLNIGARPFLRFLEQFSSIRFNKEKIPLLQAWNGSASLVLNPSQIIENEYISYEFDDDFNKIEVKKTTQEKVTDFKANFGVEQRVLREVLAIKKFHREGNDTLLFKGANFAVKGNGSSFLCYNKHLERPKLADARESAPLNMQLNYEWFLRSISGFGIKTDSLWLNRFTIENIELKANKEDKLKVNLKVLFENRDKNAFFSIAEKLGQ